MIKDSLVYSEEENLLAECEQQTKHKQYFHNLQTIKVQKFSQRGKDRDDEDCFRKYLVAETEGQDKSFKKIDKDKERFLNYDNGIKRIALKQVSTKEKMNELVGLIQMERLNRSELKIIQYGKFLCQFAQDLINQKKSIQKQYEELVQFNQIAIMKLKQINQFFQGTGSSLSQSSVCPNCDSEFSFSKKRQQVRSEEKFEFAKTIIGTLEEFQLKRIEEQQHYSQNEMNFAQLLLYLKNKAEGGNQEISRGLVDRLCSGVTLKQWIKIIDQRLSAVDTKQFLEVEKVCRKELLDEFIEVIKKNSEKFMKKIKESGNPKRENQFIRYSTIQTFMNILAVEKKQFTKQIALGYFGELNRQLTIIQKKSGIQQNEQHASSTKEVIQYLQRLFEQY